jgi:glycosyltransferase involved in cell wall biosynthesis
LTESLGNTSNIPAKKILFVINDAKFFLSHRLQIALALKNAGHAVGVVAPPHSDSVEIKRHGLTFIEITLKPWSNNPVSNLLLCWQLTKLYQTFSPDVVHHVTIKPVIFGSIAARLAKVPFVVNALSGLGYVFLKKGLFASLRRRIVIALYRRALNLQNQTLIVQNVSDKEFANSKLGVNKENIILVNGSGVNLDRFIPVKSENSIPIVLFPGRLLWSKGLKEFVEAAKVLRNFGRAARFVVVGSRPNGNPDAVPLEYILKCEAEKVVEFWGHQSEMLDVYRQADIICLPSHREGLSKTLLEAAACAKPLVTTNVPGCREVVKDEFNGFLVPANDQLALSVALDRLVNDRALCELFGNNSRKFVEEGGFSEEDVLMKTMEIYQKIIPGLKFESKGTALTKGFDHRSTEQQSQPVAHAG